MAMTPTELPAINVGDDEATDELVPPVKSYAVCHLCGKRKEALSAVRAWYLLAFHYDRRHRGWTNPGVMP